jgi:hypothetical protein
MRQTPSPIWAALLGAAFFVCGSVAAQADPVTPTALVPALYMYIDTLVELHAAPAVCPHDRPAADYVGNWQQAEGIFLSTLWANDFPTDFVRSATTRLDAPPATIKVNCADRAAAAYLSNPSQADWVAIIKPTLAGIELDVIATPVDPKVWAAIKDTIAKALPGQKHLLDCVAVSETILLPSVVHEWDGMLARLAAELFPTGLPRDEITAALGAAEANALWHRAAPDEVAGLRDACGKDLGWWTEFHAVGFPGLRADVEKLLPAAMPTSAGN